MPFNLSLPVSRCLMAHAMKCLSGFPKLLVMSYESIKNYSLTGDGHGCALISKEASVDWLILGRFDNNPLCWSLLDQNGAKLCLSFPQIKDGVWRRRYLEDTNILIHEFTNQDTLVRITDFMPVGRRPESKTHDYTNLTALHALVRKIELFSDHSQEIRIHQSNKSWPGGSKKFSVYEGFEKILEKKDPVFSHILMEGTPYYLVLSELPLFNLTATTLEKLFHVTKTFWKEWIRYSLYRGPHEDFIKRSALALKMMIFSPSGAILAAPTTSLPEWIGGERNWDYRYCWLRDATFTLYALGYMGYSGEADAFSEYMNKTVRKNQKPLQILYALDGTGETKEKIIQGLSGYRNSQPVRTGNDAFKQRQLDAFGDFIDWAYLHKALGGTISDIVIDKIEETANLVQQVWKQKDRCIWEVRGEKEDFTYSKIMCWVALDRAGPLLKKPDLFKKTKQEIELYVKSQCMHSSGRLKRSVQSDDIDASLLLSRPMGFPLDEAVYEKTVAMIASELKTGPYVRRYRVPDGINRKEGCFIICSFWLVNAYLILGHEQKAQELFSELLGVFNKVGLLSEEVDPASGDFLGNFPQALSHLAFIETASYFELYKKGGKKALEGCHADRVRRLHRTLHGPRAVFNYLSKTKNFDKLIPAWRTQLRWID